MKETPILFTPENIRAIRHGRKWQTRRVGKFQPRSHNGGELYEVTHVHGGVFDCHYKDANGPDNPRYVRCPYGRSGDKLYIKEGVIIHADGKTLSGYYMDGARVTNLGEKRLTAMFMPKRFARIWLEITDVRVQRVQDISEEDAIAEGVYTWSEMGPLDICARPLFGSLWDSINGKKRPWSSNPWVWAISFRKVQA